MITINTPYCLKIKTNWVFIFSQSRWEPFHLLAQSPQQEVTLYNLRPVSPSTGHWGLAPLCPQKPAPYATVSSWGLFQKDGQLVSLDEDFTNKRSQPQKAVGVARRALLRSSFKGCVGPTWTPGRPKGVKTTNPSHSPCAKQRIWKYMCEADDQGTSGEAVISEYYFYGAHF